MKQLSFLALPLTVTSFSGCASIPPPTETVLEFDTDGKCAVRVLYRKQAGEYNNFCQLMSEDLGLSFENSQQDFLPSNFNDSAIELKSNESILAIKNITYTNYGQTLKASDENIIVNWLASYDN